MKRPFIKYLSVLLLASVCGVVASPGDSSPNFQHCVAQCSNQQCQPASNVPLPLPLQLTRWTCTDDCKYICMHEITDIEISRGEPVQQYYGKWPFWRLGGMQEPASVAFSLLNLWAHIEGYRKTRKTVPDAHPMKPFILLWSLFSINAWFWSAVFHTRDTPMTEKLDYFSAALAILNALYYTIIRLLHLYPQPSRTRLTASSESTAGSSQKILRAVCILVYLLHTSYLNFSPRFDYTYNMMFNVILGILHNILWTLYALPSSLSVLRRFPGRPKSYRPTFATKAGIFVALTTAATALELFDFAPWERIIDAHSLWHLATAPIVYMWYSFLIEDSLDSSWREQRT